ncbi:MAG: transporter substrate-binding domain-containing protein [Eggerthellaceae bacterium]|nr:transporter substrate-binding domain-containing protein [Eggerthellaceae bacterium]
MRKRFVGIAAVAAALVLALGLLAGCGSSGSSSAASASGSASASASESASASGSAVYRTLDDIKASGKIVIGVFSDKHPFGYVDEGGEYAGYDVELANRLAEDLGVEVEFVSTEAANRVEYLETGKVDVILANFTVTEERAQKVDFCDPYMNVALGVVSHDDNVITDLSQIGDGEVIVITGTTAETYLTENNPEIKLKKFETYANAKTAFENKEGVAWANDNTEVIAFANSAKGFTVGIEELGSLDTIAPAVSKGNTELLQWINEDMEKLGAEKFFHAAYEKTLLDVYGADYEDTLVVEPGQAK